MIKPSDSYDRPCVECGELGLPACRYCDACRAEVLGFEPPDEPEADPDVEADRWERGLPR